MPMTTRLRCLRPSSEPLKLALILGLLLAVAGCGSTPNTSDTKAVNLAVDVIPKAEPKSRYGNMQSYVVLGKRYYTKGSSRNHIERGLASWYGKKFHGRKTSSGERYDMHRMTAAHKTLPLPTYALVTNLENGRSAVVKVNDRGPFVGNRIIDLSYAAAQRLDMVTTGTAHVEVRSIDPRDHGKDAKKLLRLASVDVSENAWGLTAGGGPSSVASGDSPASRPQQVATSASSPAARSSPTAINGRPIFVQVGAFGSLGNAEQLKSQLTQRVEEPVLVRAAAVDTALTPLYKVQVGPVRTRSDADALGRRLAALGIKKPILVVR